MSFTDPQKWQEVKEVFFKALELPPDDRASFLDSACRNDAELRREVEKLLASSDAATDFMRTPPINEVADVFTNSGHRLKVGQIFGQYRIIRSIGKGGMGEVYLAEDSRLGRKVALKILSSVFDLDPEGLRRFIREAKVVSTLNHPNILTIYESGEEDSIKFIASEFVEGETLTERLRSGPLSAETALDIAVQIAGALLAAHGAAIVHRDIKPDNIMIRPDGVVKLLDFGIAKLAEPLRLTGPGTAPGIIIGTPNYLSPEQARGKNVDARSDIFSFGLVLYEMFTGVKTFEAENAIDVISSILQKEPIPASRIVPGISPEIAEMISRTLRKRPEERYSAAADLLFDLKRLRSELALQNKLNVAPTVDPVITTAGSVPDAKLDTGGELQPVTAKYTLREYARHNRRTVGIAAAILTVVFGSGLWYFYSAGAFSRPRIDSIAVLPFANETGSPDTDYLSDGIAETLISSLSRVPELNVRSRTSAFSYKGKGLGMKQIAKELNVQAILNGRVAERGDDLTLYVELVDIAADKVIWSETYKRPVSSLLALQSEIVRDVSGSLRAKLSGADEQRLTKGFTTNSDAYRLNLKGNYEWNKHTEAALQKAIGFYDQALEIDPNYALAYTGLSKTYGVLGNNYLPPNETLPKAREFVQKALAIDDSLAEAHAVMAAVHLYYEWDSSAAEAEIARAIALDPNNGLAHQLEASRLESTGQFDEALIERKRALVIDPLSPMDNFLLGTTYYLDRDPENALVQLRQTIDMEPRFSPSYLFLGQSYELKKMYPDAIKAYKDGLSQSEENPKLIASLAHAYAVSGDIDQANAMLSKLREIAKSSYVSPYLFAVVYAGLGDRDEMFAALETAFKDRPADLLWLRVEPIFSPFRDDPRFQAVLKGIGV